MITNKIANDQVHVASVAATSHDEFAFEAHGNAHSPLEITLVNTDATAVLRYRLDGTAAGANDRPLLPLERLVLHRGYTDVSVYNPSAGPVVVEVTFSA